MHWFLILLVIASTVSSQQLFESGCKKIESKSMFVTIVEGNETNSGRVAPGTVAQLECADFFLKNSKAPNKTRCQRDGKWSNTAFSCASACGLGYDGPSADEEEQDDLELDEDVGNRNSFGAQVQKLPPWNAALYLRNSSVYKLICGASLIHPMILITAAHCVFDEKIKGARAVREMKVGLAKYHTDYNKEDEHQLIVNIRETFIERGYKGAVEGYSRDIALIVLEVEVSLSFHVRPICIPFARGNQPLEPGTKGLVFSWGLTEKAVMSEKLQKTWLPYVDRETCRSEVSAQLANAITEDKFCAGYKNGTKVGHGDSGSGFTVADRTGKQHFLFGIVSYGRRDLNTLAGFTDVLYFLDFIDKTYKQILNKYKPSIYD